MTRRPWSITIAAIVIVAMLAQPGAAHEPTPNRDGAGYASSDTLRRVFSSTYDPPSWVETAVDLAIDHAPDSDADIPQFSTSTGIVGYIYYRARNGSHCADLPTAWACADNNPWHITYMTQGEDCGAGCVIDWCEHPSSTGYCIHANRAAIHELGHVLDLDHHPDDVEGWTVMYRVLPADGETGDETSYYQTCDRARLLMKHGPENALSRYASCLDHIEGGEPGYGLKTVVSFYISDESPCRYQSVAFYGYAHTADIAAIPDPIQHQPLQGRDVWVQYRAHGSNDSWQTLATDTYTSSTGYWWTSFAFSSLATYDVRAHLVSDEGLDGDTSSEHLIQVLAC